MDWSKYINKWAAMHQGAINDLKSKGFKVIYLEPRTVGHDDKYHLLVMYAEKMYQTTIPYAALADSARWDCLVDTLLSQVRVNNVKR